MRMILIRIKLAHFLPSKIRASLPMHQYGARYQGAMPCKIRASLPMRFKRDLRYLGDAQALCLISVLTTMRSRRYGLEVQPQRLCGRCACEGARGWGGEILAFTSEPVTPPSPTPSHRAPQLPTIITLQITQVFISPANPIDIRAK